MITDTQTAMSANRHVLQLQGAALLASLGRALLLPVLPLLLNRQLGLSTDALGALLGLPVFGSVLLGLYGGYLLDRYNRRHLAMLALALHALVCLLLPWQHKPWLAGVLLLTSETMLLVFASGQKTMLAAMLPPQQRVRQMSHLYVLLNLAFALGPWLGVFSYRQLPALPFWLAALLASLALCLIPRAAAERQTVPAAALPVGGIGRVLADRSLLRLILAGCLVWMALGRMSAYMPLLLLHSHSSSQIADWMSLLFTINAVTVVVSQLLLGRWLASQSTRHWLLAGAVCLLAGFACLWGSDTLTGWGIGMVWLTLAETILVPIEYKLIDRIAPEQQKGLYYSAQQLANLGAALGPCWVGLLMSGAHASAALAGLAGFSIVGCVLMRGSCARRGHRVVSTAA